MKKYLCSEVRAASANRADFSALWDKAVETALDKVESVVYRLALAGNLQAAEFLLKWRRRGVYNNTSDSDHTSNTTNFIMNVTMQEHLERLERLGLPAPVIESDREEDDAT